MEKRERRNRSRRPRDPPSRNDPPPPNNSVGNTANKKDEKKIVEEKTEKKVIDHTAIPDPHMFDNLKRETEDIAALKRPVVGGKRQIFSNWAKYETPMCSDADGDRLGKIGEDFEALLQQGGQKGGHFRFKSERGWDPESAAVRSAVLTLDLVALAEALTSIPLYERLDLPTDVFMAGEIERMDKQAKESAALLQVNQTKRTPEAKVEAEKVSASILAKLMEKDDMEEAPVKVDLRVDGDVQPLEFDMNDLSDPVATTQWDTPSVVEGKEPSEQPQIVMPEVQPRESPARSEEGASKESPEVEVPEPLEELQQSAPAPVIEEHSVTSEPQSPVESWTAKPEPTASAKGGQSGKMESGRRQGKRHKGKDKKDRRSWASSEEGDAEVAADKVEPQPPLEPVVPQKGPTTAPQQTAQHVPQLQTAPELPVVLPPSAPETAQQQSRKCDVPEGGKKQRGERAPPKQHNVKEVPTTVLNPEPKRRSPVSENELPKHPLKPSAVSTAPAPKKAPAPVAKSKPGDDDQLDFLLSLRHPVKEEPVAFNAPSSTAVRASIDEEESVPASVPQPLETKKEVLEDWLDSMLDD